MPKTNFLDEGPRKIENLIDNKRKIDDIKIDVRPKKDQEVIEDNKRSYVKDDSATAVKDVHDGENGQV